MLASALAIGIAAGLFAGGRLSNLGRLRLTWAPVLIVAVGLRLLAGAAGEFASMVYVIAFLGVVAVGVVNRHVPGAALIAIGAGLNTVVVALNGAMPVSREAIAAVGGTFPVDPLHRQLDETSRLVPLADIIPFPVIRTAYSVGDVFIAVGGFLMSFRVVRGR